MSQAVKRFATCSIVGVLLAATSAGQQERADPVLEVMARELGRIHSALKRQPVPPYFLSYQLTDNRAVHITAAFGALTSSDDHRTRILDVDLRVGDYTLDNTHELRGSVLSMPDFAEQFGRVPVPVEDAPPDALRMALWRETENRYRRAVERLAQVRSNVQVKVEQEDKSPDFSREAAAKYDEPLAQFSFDRKMWEEKLRKFTAPFGKHPEIIEAQAHVVAEVETRRYVNSDGNLIRLSSPLYRLNINGSTKAEDGMELPLHETYISFRLEGLPTDDTVLKDVERMIQRLQALRRAPLAEPYTGPAILSGRASAVFFHEIFGHRIEGQRQKREDDAQTFKKRINQPVLPDFISVYSDPTLRATAGKELVGFYLYDDEGVKSRPVAVVEKGILKNFLMSRAPVEGFDRSNGHGRRQQGFKVTARQSNLLVRSSRTVPRQRLKAMLIAQIRTARRPYGLLFEDIEGGFTFTGRMIPNAFNVLPTVVYRIFPDGREELVRGVDLIGTPLVAFSKITATDDQVEVFNGVCGAESGWVPVSAVSPAILVSQMEVQRKLRSQERLPSLPPPPEGPSQ